MKKQQTPLIVGLIAIIVVAVGLIWWQMRPQTSGGSGATPGESMAPIAGGMQGGRLQPGGAVSPTDEARARGEFTPAPK
ncbi:MAG: hypothetical protein NZT92_01470 [Abditibacteriales bacterium]|nr:hypothetical protein [Abditibacteriales bacterium]MDW8364835.1 hypothetical protein [Abditibacteriales bacterium]